MSDSSQDISKLLRDWPYEAGKTLVRQVEGLDGKPKLQLRIPLGLLQMEMEGRPDGMRPEGFESYLDYQKDRVARYARESGGPEGFVLTPEECRLLREEAILYYHRYVGLFMLEQYEGVVRDTNRNLEVMDLCTDFAATDQDREALERFRPYVLMMRTRSLATMAIQQQEPKRALAYINQGIEEITEALTDLGMEGQLEESNELQLLMGMRESLVPKLPTSQRVELEERLRAALDAENYELAAILRDELRLLRD